MGILLIGMPFYNLYVDWVEPLDEMTQFNRLEQALGRHTEHLIVGITCLSTIRGRITVQTERLIGPVDFEWLKIDGATRTVLSPVHLGESGFPLLEISSDAVEL